MIKESGISSRTNVPGSLFVPNPENIPDGVSEPRQAPIPRSRPGVKGGGERKEERVQGGKKKKYL